MDAVWVCLCAISSLFVEAYVRNVFEMSEYQGSMTAEANGVGLDPARVGEYGIQIA